ncbi:MAG: TMEM165/GDT1 family protein [Xanthomonadales bacterium]|jgi:putative Ca2+/H+ antiporter (TMEM165/GDT1 family)|nr:TMEM165/GDT1 family protein [Xanthomonadales bacterium]
MEALLFSTLAVAIAEIGDKTQLLSLILAARYRRFWPIAWGILVATLLNHALAGWLGAVAAHYIPEGALRWILFASLLGMAIWVLIPDRLDDEDAPKPRFGPFIATTIAFFIAEMGDKTQIATVLLAAKYEQLAMVVLGTTLGMLLANVPVVALGARFAHRLPLKAARYAAAVVFAVLAVLVLVQAGTG